MAKAHPNQFKLWYTVDRPSDGWKFDKVTRFLFFDFFFFFGDGIFFELLCYDLDFEATLFTCDSV